MRPVVHHEVVPSLQAAAIQRAHQGDDHLRYEALSKQINTMVFLLILVAAAEVAVAALTDPGPALPGHHPFHAEEAHQVF